MNTIYRQDTEMKCLKLFLNEESKVKNFALALTCENSLYYLADDFRLLSEKTIKLKTNYPSSEIVF